MPGIDNESGAVADFQQHLNESQSGITHSDLESLVKKVVFEGKLNALMAHAFEMAAMYEPLSHADPGSAPHPGVQAAIQAFTDWKRTKEGSTNMDMTVQPHPGLIKKSAKDPDILPLSLVGKWVAWSSDGMRILASAETSEEAESLAVEQGETDPILHHPMALR